MKKLLQNAIIFTVIMLFFFILKSSAQKTELMIQTGHQRNVQYMSISPDETKMFSVDNDLTGILWDINTAKQLRVFRNIKAGEFNADSKSLMISYNDKSFKNVDLNGDVLNTYSATFSSGWMAADAAKLYIQPGLLITSSKIFKIRQRKTIDIDYYRPNSVNYASLKGQVILGGINELTVLDTINGSMIKKIPLNFEKEEPVEDISFSKDNNIMLAAGSLFEGSVNVVDFNTSQVLKTFKFKGLYSATISPDAKAFFIVTRSKIAMIDAASGNEIWSGENSKQYTSINFFYSGNEIILSNLNGKEFAILSVEKGAMLQNIISASVGEIKSVQLLTDQKTLTAQSNNQLIYWGFSSGKMDSIIAHAESKQTGVFAHTKNEVLSKENSSSETLDFYDMPSHKLIYQITDPEFKYLGNYFFSSTDKYIAFPKVNGVTILEIETKKKTSMFKGGPSSSYSTTATFTPDDQSYVVGNSSGMINFYNIAQQKMEPDKNLLAHNSGIRSITFSKDGILMITSGEDNSIKIWDYKTRTLIATLYSFPETNDWAVLTPDGHFDGTTGAQKIMYYIKGSNTIDLSDMYEKFYTPRLLTRILNGEKINKENIDINNIHPKPRVKIQYAQKTRNLEVSDDSPLYANTTGLAELIINATAQDDKVDEIRLFHNGKIVNLATRGLFVTDDKTGNETKKYTLSLLPGQNTFRAVALNGQRTESKADEISVNYKTEKPEENKPAQTNNTLIIDAVDKTATMYLVVIGINKYQNEKLSLNYALADATAFKDEIEKDAKTVLGNVKTFFVTDNTADKKGITDALTEVQKNAKPQDVFVFYYAGHGYISDKTKEFYLVPTDVADIKNVDEVLLQKGISAKMLQTYAIDIQAQKQIFILDACQSAGAFEALLTADANQQKSLAVVSRSTGTHWMAASGSKQYAQEFTTLKHGAFTYVLLQALQGQAAANKMITVNGLKTFMQVQVPELMKKYNSEPQYPASYGLGNDFPVEIVK